MHVGGLGCVVFVSVFFLNSRNSIAGTLDEPTLRGALTRNAAVNLKGTPRIDVQQPFRIERDAVVRGNGKTILSGGGTTRLFEVGQGATLTLIGLTLADGFSTNGGAVYTDGGTIVAIDCTFSNNMARGQDGVTGGKGVYGIAGSNGVPPMPPVPGGVGGSGTSGTPGRGGAVFCRGTLILSNVLFLRNTAQGGRGGDGGLGGDGPTYVQTGHGGYGGDGGDAGGGAIFVEGDSFIWRADFFANMALSGAGGFGSQPGTNADRFYLDRQAGESGLSGNARGGAAISSGRGHFIGCRFEENSAIGAAGAFGVPVIEGIRSYEVGKDGRNGQSGGGAEGGAIWGVSELIIQAGMFAGNSALGGAGGAGAIGGHGHSGPFLDGGDGGHAGNGGHAYGGSVCSTGELVISGSSFWNSLAASGDGGLGGWGGTTAVPNGRAKSGGNGGAAGACSGGAIKQMGTLTVDRSEFRHSVAAAGRGGRGGMVGGAGQGYYLGTGPWGLTGECLPAFGGAIHSEGINALVRCQLLANVVMGGNGTNGGTASTSKVGPAHGQPGNAGGSVFGAGAFLSGKTFIEASTIASNQCRAGSAGSAGHGGSSLYESSAGGWGGAGGNALGAGVYAVGSFNALNCTIAFNQAFGGNGGNGSGGGISTAFGQRGPSGKGGNGGNAGGAGIFVWSNSYATIEFCTFAANSGTNGAAGSGGPVTAPPSGTNGIAGIFEGSAVATLGGGMKFRNSIVANGGSTATRGVVDDAGGNICSDYTCAFYMPASRQGFDPRLDSLNDNRGITLTMALLPGSLAIDAGIGPCPPTDQRGYSRSAGTSCDIGAFEFNATASSRMNSLFGTILQRSVGLPGICVRIGDEMVFTDFNGRFERTELAGGRIVVQPKDESFVFHPRSRRVNLRAGQSLEMTFRAHTSRR